MQPGVQDRGEPPRGGLLAAESSVAPQFRPEPATLVPVDPDEEPRMGSRGRTISHTVGPVLGEAVVLRGCGEAAAGDRQPHRDVGPAAAHVVSP